MNKTTNKYWIYLEWMKKSGGYSNSILPLYLSRKFEISKEESSAIVKEWAANYNPKDYI